MDGPARAPRQTPPAAPPTADPGGELSEERKEFSDRLAGFGLGEATERLLRDISRRPAGPNPTPA